MLKSISTQCEIVENLNCKNLRIQAGLPYFLFTKK